MHGVDAPDFSGAVCQERLREHDVDLSVPMDDDFGHLDYLASLYYPIAIERPDSAIDLKLGAETSLGRARILMNEEDVLSGRNIRSRAPRDVLDCRFIGTLDLCVGPDNINIEYASRYASVLMAEIDILT